MHRNSAVFGALLAIWLLSPSRAAAGPLPGDTAAMTLWQGTSVPYYNQTYLAANNTTYELDAHVEYAVYAPGQFSTSSALGSPTDPSGGADYIYAYEFFNTSPTNTNSNLGPVGVKIQNFTVSLLAGAVPTFSTVAHNSTTPEAGMAPAASLTHFNASFNSAVWGFVVQPGTGTHSDILILASPNPPTWMSSGMTATNTTDSHLLPSPVPEPSSMILAAFAATFLLATRLIPRQILPTRH